MVFSKPAANLTSKYVATVYHSDTYKVILDIETGLFSQSMAHVLTILQRKLKEGKIAARWNRRIAALTQNRPLSALCLSTWQGFPGKQRISLPR